MKKHRRQSVQGQIIITRSSDDKYHVYIDDVSSGVRLAEVVMDAGNFARAITAMVANCQVSIPDAKHLDRVGKRYEWETHFVPGINPETWHDRHWIAQNFAEERGVEYDEVNLDGEWNHHRSDAGNPRNYSVAFYRWVELAEEGDTP